MQTLNILFIQQQSASDHQGADCTRSESGTISGSKPPLATLKKERASKQASQVTKARRCFVTLDNMHFSRGPVGRLRGGENQGYEWHLRGLTEELRSTNG